MTPTPTPRTDSRVCLAHNLELVKPDHPALTTVCDPVPEVTDEIRAIAARMLDICREKRGIGLAANQVGLTMRLFVTLKYNGQENVYINPVLLTLSGPAKAIDEGCLTRPGEVFTIYRRENAVMKFTALDGCDYTDDAHGLYARVWQHECDHLDGIQPKDKVGTFPPKVAQAGERGGGA